MCTICITAHNYHVDASYMYMSTMHLVVSIVGLGLRVFWFPSIAWHTLHPRPIIQLRARTDAKEVARIPVTVPCGGSRTTDCRPLRG